MPTSAHFDFSCRIFPQGLNLAYFQTKSSSNLHFPSFLILGVGFHWRCVFCHPSLGWVWVSCVLPHPFIDFPFVIDGCCIGWEIHWKTSNSCWESETRGLEPSESRKYQVSIISNEIQLSGGKRRDKANDSELQKLVEKAECLKGEVLQLEKQRIELKNAYTLSVISGAAIDLISVIV